MIALIIFGTITNKEREEVCKELVGGREGGRRREKRGMSGRFVTAADARVSE